MYMSDYDMSGAYVGWKPSKPLFISINTDGGIVRGDQGEWIGGYAKGVGSCSAFKAELWGVLEGLRYVRSLGFNKIELNIDSEVVVRVIKTGRSRNVAGSALTDQILKMMTLDWEVEVHHTYREANKCADAMANYGCSIGFDTQYFNSCPVFITELFEADSLGLSMPRLIPV
ncbi:hypothetical protein TSUD_141690 [Trifolium subterraneum]|uniref:RNase H type-1 domain-containing protein n=1 Tax=Trifolium subterraneum TaxID=3900 RepID=A0A2Z6PRB7_TRISU|nr:hypothetical protein TSUD_141690 [Trifolium subterraneum]